MLEFNVATTSQYSTSVAPLMGRILVAALFIASGMTKLAAPTATQGYIASIGIPEPILAYVAAVVIELGGGVLLLLGYRVRYISLVLAAYCAITALLFHHALGDQNQLFHFLKNLAIAGGLLMVFAFGAGAWSLDARGARVSAGVSRAGDQH